MEFSIEVTPLLICVWPNAKKKGGKKELHSPAINNHFQSLLVSVLNDLNPRANNNNEAKTILNPPTCIGVKPTKDFLMRIKEDPHIKERTVRYIHLFSTNFKS